MGLVDTLQRSWRNWRLRRRVARLPYAAKGQNVVLHNGSLFFPPERIRFGRDIYVGPEATFWADGGLTIHDNVIFGPRVTIFTSNHVVEGADFLPYGPVTELGPVEIFENVWVGACSLILPGVRIGEGAVIAAGAVVTRNVPPLAFVAGNPAQVRRYREPQRYLELKREGRLFMAWKRERPGELAVRHVERAARPGPMAHAPEAQAARRELRLDDYDFQG